MVNPTASRRAAAAEETRLQIVEAARQLFVAQGYVATTIDAIADEAGVAVWRGLVFLESLRRR